MDKRSAKVSIGPAGGTAGKGAKTYKLTIPSAWIAEMQIDEGDRAVELTYYDDGRIVVTRPAGIDAFIEQKTQLQHELTVMTYRDGEKVCTRIAADFTDKTLCVENAVDDPAKTAFGADLHPAWEDLQDFLEERCVPRERAGIREYLEALGLEEYDPLEIVRRTQGRMAEDDQWLEVE